MGTPKGNVIKLRNLCCHEDVKKSIYNFAPLRQSVFLNLIALGQGYSKFQAEVIMYYLFLKIVSLSGKVNAL